MLDETTMEFFDWLTEEGDLELSEHFNKEFDICQDPDLEEA